MSRREDRSGRWLSALVLAAVLAAGIAIGVAGTRLVNGPEGDREDATGAAAESVPEIPDGQLFDYTENGTVVLGNYKTMVVAVTPDKETVDAQLQYVAEDAEKKYKVKKGDYAFVDYVGTLEGETSEELTASDVALKIGDYVYEKEFEDGLLGRKAGSIFNIRVHYGTEYPDEFVAGRDVDYSVSLRAVFNDAMAKAESKGKYPTVESYREYASGKLKKENEENIRELAWVDFMGICQVNERSEKQVQEELETLKRNYTRVAEADKVTYEELLAQLELNEENLRDQAEDNVGERMVAKTLAKREGLTLDDEAYRGYLMRILGYTEKDDMSLASLVDEYREDYGNRPRDDVLVAMVKRFIAENVSRV